MTVKFTKNQVKVLEKLLSDASKFCENDSEFHGYISSGLKFIIDEKCVILPSEEKK